MATKKQITFGFIILLLLAVTFICGCTEVNMFSKKPLLDFSELIENENINNISLTIYYISPYILTDIPLSVDDLINSNSVKKIVINGNDLEEHIDLFKHISNDVLLPVKKKSYLDARLYYVLESKENGKLFDVTMWGGDNNSIFVNGFEVKENYIFYDLVKPFLPEDAAKELDNYVAGIWPE